MAIQINSDASASAIAVNPLSSVNKLQQPAKEVEVKLLDEQKQLENIQVKDRPEEETLNENEQKALEDAVEVIADFMNLSIKNVNFAKDDGSDKTVIKVFDSESKELIKQFPSEEVLEIAQRIVELRQDVGKKTGILLDEKV